jgi:uncharacterized protein (DUF433 family)
MATVTTRITIEAGTRGGKPCIRGLRIAVWDVLGWLGAGMSEDEILDEHPDLEKRISEFAKDGQSGVLTIRFSDRFL